MKPIVLSAIRNAAGAIAMTVALAGCVPKSDSGPKPIPVPHRPAPKPTPAPTPTYNSWMDVPATTGDWTYQTQPAGGIARFADTQSGLRFAFACDRTNRRISLIRPASAVSAVPMTIRTEFGDRTLTATPRDAAHSELVASLAASDGFLDSMALTKGRFAVEIKGLPTLYLPAWAEVSRVIEDCR